MTYASAATVTITLASLASSSTFVAGREATAIDNTSNLYVDALLSGKITVGTSPTANTQICVFVFGMLDDSNWPDVMDGTDSDETITSVGVAQGFLKLAAVMNVIETTSDRSFYFGPVSVAALFGGILPKKWNVFVAQSTAAVLNATGSNHSISYVGIS